MTSKPLLLFVRTSYRRGRQNSQPPWKSTRGARPNLADRTKLFDGLYPQDLTTKGKIFKARLERAH